MTTAQIQQALKDAGFDPGAIDGKDGAHTRAAVKAYQSAHGLTPDGIAGPKTQAALQGGSATAPTAAAPATDATTAAIGDEYPDLLWALHDPEIGPLLTQAANAQPPWSPAVLQAHVSQTNWWRNNNEQARDYLKLAATDPAELATQMNAIGSAQKFLAKNASYGLPMSMDWALKQVDRVVRGELTADQLDQIVVEQAKAMYPQLATQFDQGQTADQVFEPYRQMAAQTLGVNPATILVTDPKWQQLMTVTDDKGGKRLATMDEAQQLVRTDGRFGFNQSQSGRNFYNDAAQAVGTAFGNVAS